MSRIIGTLCFYQKCEGLGCYPSYSKTFERGNDLGDFILKTQPLVTEGWPVLSFAGMPFSLS